MTGTVGLVRVLTTDDMDLLEAHGRVLAAVHGLDVVTRCIPDQPHGVHDDASFDRAAAKVADLVAELAPHVDAVIVSCAADPGLAVARARTDRPVSGPARPPPSAR